ncbi:dephospho-CoA kinase [Spongiimicrobium salis]|uniref:dephospho-CoA kinase n=1 Tax=Spongiimicrobium salis TaxID=1667022 RepID=UPI00374CD6A4
MMIVGLTGGIGSGKTTVARMFEALGVPVYNSDKEAKQLMRTSEQLKKEIKKLLGDQAYEYEELNKPFIANAIFNNEVLLKKLNALVHPAVAEHFTQWAREQSSPYVIQETAIIFENGSQDRYDAIILVTAPEELRLARVLDRDKNSRTEVLARMRNQWDDVKKRALSHFEIENIDIDKTRSDVRKLHDYLQKQTA